MMPTQAEIEHWLPNALEHLFDHSYLGHHPLARLRVVERYLVHDQTPLTHVDRGRALGKVLQVGIEELKPLDTLAEVGSEAHFYRILCEAYREGRENRAVALDLAISERTFYRQRRRAVAALAEVLWDMEKATLAE